MALFNKNNDDTHSGSTAPITSMLGKDLRLVGELSFKGKTQIDGTVEGNVQGEHLILSEVGRIKGDVAVDSLLCHGSIEGNIKTKLLTLAAKASVRGRISAVNLTVEAGASIDGEIQASNFLSPQEQTPRAASLPDGDS